MTANSTLGTNHRRCYGDESAECADCLRRIERGHGTHWTWWIVPPVVRPCAERVEMEQVA